MDALIEGGEQPAELALGGGLGAAHGDVFAAPLAPGVAAHVDGELPRAGGALAEGAFHVSWLIGGDCSSIGGQFPHVQVGMSVP